VFRSGDTITNPVTGETFVFHKTAAETNGEYVQFECIVEAGGQVAAAHVHPYQAEYFEVLEGTIGVKAGREQLELGAGEAIEIEAGTSHTWWNAGDSRLRFLVEVRPALQFEAMIATMFALAQDGKTNSKGMPNPLRLAAIAKHHFDDVRLPLVPAWAQKSALVMGAACAKLVGYGPSYAPAGEPAAAAA
jgi:quercetin dioxygenase-like cupin family protein